MIMLIMQYRYDDDAFAYDMPTALIYSMEEKNEYSRNQLRKLIT